ncbi:hypothetical protein ARTSIC4J27_2972 [Pseudarthrobacter siccitolerans]|uniref:Uncharacterized protein n=1 Tax=Pseudarthrobacter siccitolerans TaxID=861266 RepID=A0A024H4D0_9MICC|nr:hypothetical protein ARTSIC4J27_2972 [Pseudarthrobacter siccitolerans]
MSQAAARIIISKSCDVLHATPGFFAGFGTALVPVAGNADT